MEATSDLLTGLKSSGGLMVGVISELASFDLPFKFP